MVGLKLPFKEKRQKISQYLSTKFPYTGSAPWGLFSRIFLWTYLIVFSLATFFALRLLFTPEMTDKLIIAIGITYLLLAEIALFAFLISRKILPYRIYGFLAFFVTFVMIAWLIDAIIERAFIQYIIFFFVLLPFNYAIFDQWERYKPQTFLDYLEKVRRYYGVDGYDKEIRKIKRSKWYKNLHNPAKKFYSFEFAYVRFFGRFN